MPYLLSDRSADELNAMMVERRNLSKLEDKLPKHKSLYHLIVPAVICDLWEFKDAQLGYKSKIRFFKEYATLDPMEYPVWHPGGSDGLKEVPPPFGKGLPVRVVWRGGWTVLSTEGGHLTGTLMGEFVQNAGRNGEATVSVGGFGFTHKYKCMVPFAQPNEKMKAGRRVAISINQVTQRWEIIAGEC